MRAAMLLLVACGSPPVATAPAAIPAEPVVIANSTKSCADAALALEAATRSVRDPDRSVFEALQARCIEDAWPTPAVDCFTKMQEGELGRCARALTETKREAVFAVLADSAPERAGIAIARARLEQLSVGIVECDQFVTAVIAALGCEAMSVDTRVQLGNETAQFWSLPTDRLGEDDLRRMSAVCAQSLQTLQQQTASVGCMP